jgi:hypothetical protein
VHFERVAMRFNLRFSRSFSGLLSLLGMPRQSSHVEIDRARGVLRVNAGIWFHEDLPLADVASVQSSSWPWYGGYGVKLGPGGDTVSVVACREGVVEVSFVRPQKMRVLLVVARSKLRLSLEQPEEFMRALRASLPATGAEPARAS